MRVYAVACGRVTDMDGPPAAKRTGTDDRTRVVQPDTTQVNGMYAQTEHVSSRGASGISRMTCLAKALDTVPSGRVRIRA